MGTIEFVDQTLRDGQQSLWGMRMRAGHALPVAAATIAGRKSTARSTASTPASSPISTEVTPSAAASFATLSAK